MRPLALALAVIVLANQLSTVYVTAQGLEPYYSLDPASPSLQSADTSGDVFSSPKATALRHTDLGLPAWANVDAISPGTDYVDPVDPCPNYTDPVTGNVASTVYWWSVDRLTVGAPAGGLVMSEVGPCVSGGHPIRDEALLADAPADVYMQMWDAGTPDPDVRLNFLYRDESALGLSGGNSDNIDALETTHPILAADGAPAQDTYFSVDTATATGLGVSGADVLFAPSGDAAWRIAWTAGQLGLLPEDEIDALCLDTRMADPRLLVSLGRGSSSLAMGGYSGADAFKIVPNIDPFPGSGIQVPFLTAAFLSLLQDDDVDGLDCDLFDPGPWPRVSRSSITDDPAPTSTMTPTPRRTVDSSAGAAGGTSQAPRPPVSQQPVGNPLQQTPAFNPTSTMVPTQTSLPTSTTQPTSTVQPTKTTQPTTTTQQPTTQPTSVIQPTVSASPTPGRL
jgi:hypothetical protein